MTEGQAIEALSAAFVAGWEAAEPAVPFALDNELVTLPTSGSFAAFNTLFTTSQQMTQGAPSTRRVRRQGWIQVKIWTPAGDRSQTAAGLAGTCRDIFELKTFDGPIFGEEPITVQSGWYAPVSNDGRWYIVLSRFPFWFAETR